MAWVLLVPIVLFGIIFAKEKHDSKKEIIAYYVKK